MASEPKSILVVEADHDAEQMTLDALTQCEVPSVVRIAKLRSEALDYVFGEESGRIPDLVLLEVSLPDGNGLDVLRRIREDVRSRSVPVVIFTKSVDDADIEAAYGLGVNSYVHKPQNSGEYAEAVSELAVYWLALNRSRD